jgi:TrmH family RNA methyltransferase
MLSKAQVKYIQSFSQKKFRDGEGAFIAEGPKVVSEWLHARPQDVRAVYALPDWIEEEGPALQRSGVAIQTLEAFELERISQLTTPNRVLAVIRKPVWPASPDLTRGASLYLDDIQDPGNLGTILRTADWFGVRNLICSPSTADAFNPKVVQATMGSLLRVQVYYAEPDELGSWAPDVPVWAAALEGDDMFTLRAPEAFILVIGNESKGIRPSWLARADRKVHIPRKGGAESLNASVATGILLAQLLH